MCSNIRQSSQRILWWTLFVPFLSVTWARRLENSVKCIASRRKKCPPKVIDFVGVKTACIFDGGWRLRSSQKNNRAWRNGWSSYSNVPGFRQMLREKAIFGNSSSVFWVHWSDALAISIYARDALSSSRGFDFGSWYAQTFSPHVMMLHVHQPAASKWLVVRNPPPVMSVQFVALMTSYMRPLLRSPVQRIRYLSSWDRFPLLFTRMNPMSLVCLIAALCSDRILHNYWLSKVQGFERIIITHSTRSGTLLNSYGTSRQLTQSVPSSIRSIRSSVDAERYWRMSMRSESFLCSRRSCARIFWPITVSKKVIAAYKKTSLTLNADSLPQWSHSPP